MGAGAGALLAGASSHPALFAIRNRARFLLEPWAEILDFVGRVGLFGFEGLDGSLARSFDGGCDAKDNADCR